MATEAEIIASNVLASAIEYKRLYDTTKNNEYKVKEQRLRKIAENIKLIVGSSSSSAVSSFNGRTGAVTLTATDVNGALGYTAGDMLKSVYDYDNDGVVDSAERTEIIVRNSTGSTLTKGTVVYLSGATGNRPNALRAQANSEATSSKTFGFVVSDIPNNSDGYVACAGTLHDLDTSAFADGVSLWLSPTTAGGWTTTVPSEPNHSVFLGYVARSHPTQGRVVILIQNGYELTELHDVVISSPSDGQILRYNGTAGYWENWTHSFLTSVPTLDQVTTAGNTTTNAVTVGGLTSTGTIYAGVANTTNGTIRVERTTGSTGIIIRGSDGNFIGAAGYPVYEPYKYSDASHNFNIGHASVGNYNWYVGTNATLNLNTHLMRLTRGGNLLIGTTTDSGYKLDVTGTARVTGTLTVGQIITANGTSDLIMQTHVAATSVLTVQYSSNQNGTSGSKNLITLSTTYNPTSGASLFSALNVAPTINQTGTASGVSRGIYINPTLTTAVDWRSIEWSNNTGWGLYGVGTATNYLSGKLGIGTTTPRTNVKLDVVISNTGGGSGIGITNTNASGYAEVLFNNDNARTDGVGFIGLGGSTSAASNLMYLGTREAFPLLFYTNLTEQMRIFSNGNIGINTTTDAGQKLQVLGNSRFFSSVDTYHTIESTATGSAGTIYKNTYRQYFTGTNYATANSWEVYDLTASAPVIHVSGATRAVGINKVNASYQLDVSGDIRSTIGAYFATTSGLVGIGTTSPSYKLDVNGSFRVVDGVALATASGNVLIGTTTDSGQKLQVNGSIKAVLASATTTNVVYYDSTTGLMTYGAAPSGGGSISLTTTGTSGVSTLVSGTLNIPNYSVSFTNNTAGNIMTGSGTTNTLNGQTNLTWLSNTLTLGPNSDNNTTYTITTRNQMIISANTNAANDAFFTFLTLQSGYSSNLSAVAIVGSSTNNYITFRTMATDRMRIFQSGNVAVNTTTDNGYNFEVNGSIAATAYNINGVTGYTGIFTVPTNPPGQQNIDIQSGIIVNIF